MPIWFLMIRFLMVFIEKNFFAIQLLSSLGIHVFIKRAYICCALSFAAIVKRVYRLCDEHKGTFFLFKELTVLLKSSRSCELSPVLKALFFLIDQWFCWSTVKRADSRIISLVHVTSLLSFVLRNTVCSLLFFGVTRNDNNEVILSMPLREKKNVKSMTYAMKFFMISSFF